MARLPPTAALRALESAARHLSYTKAAEELHITQSAVSHQIRHIEELWDVKLFQRRGRQITLTAAGQRVAPIVREFITRMTDAIDALHEKPDRSALRVSLLQSFAFKWLVPRLGRFTERYRDIDVWISTTEDLATFEADRVDVAIRLGHGAWPRMHVTPLLREYVFPVCSPKFLERIVPPEHPEDLFRFPLVYRHSEDICPRWRDWFRDAGTEVTSLPRGTQFPETSMTVQAAIDGQGIALARSAHVADDLAAGRLVKLFDVYSLSSVAYYIVCPEGRERVPHVAAFSEWLLEEAAVSQADFDRVAGPAANRAA